MRPRPGGRAGGDVDARDVDVAADGGKRRAGLVGVRVEEEEQRAPAGGEGLKAVAAKEAAPRDGGDDVAARKVRVEAADDNRRDPVGDGRLDDGADVGPEDDECGQTARDRLDDAVEERRPVGEADARCRARKSAGLISAKNDLLTFFCAAKRSPCNSQFL